MKTNDTNDTSTEIQTKSRRRGRSWPLDPEEVISRFHLLPNPDEDPARPFQHKEPAKERQSVASSRTRGQRKTTKTNGLGAYAVTKVGDRLIQNHRIVWILTHGRDVLPGHILDHLNRNTLDNRPENLRETTKSANGLNSRKRATRDGRPVSSQYRGVRWDKEREQWRAEVNIGGTRTGIGRFSDERLAALVHDAAKLTLLLKAGDPGLTVLGVNAADASSDITPEALWRFIGNCREIHGIDLDKILDRVARRSGLH